MRITRIENGYRPKLNNQKINKQPSSQTFTGIKPPNGGKLAIMALGLYSLVTTLMITRPIDKNPAPAPVPTEAIVETEEPVDIEQPIEPEIIEEQEPVKEPVLTNSEEQKLKEIKNFITDAKKIEEELGKATWNNFGKFYEITRGKDEIWLDDLFDGAPSTDSYADYYASFNLTSKIASGDTAFIQEEVKTGQDAMFLIGDILMEVLNSNGSHEEIDNGRHVNTGEAKVLYTVFDEFDKMNPEIQAVSQIFREEFDKAQEEADKKTSLTGLETRLAQDNNGEYSKYLVGKYMDILLDYEQMRDIKNDYDLLKKEIKDPNNISDEVFTSLYYMNFSCDETFKRICETCLLDDVYENPNITMDMRSLEDASYKAYQRCYNELGKG